MDQALAQKLTTELIKFRSLSGSEHDAVEFLAELLKNWGWPVELMPVAEGRSNLFAAFGKPEIVFTTHIDVVPAPDELFVPRVEQGTIYGRGACDAKGVLVCMLLAMRALLEERQNNFALLVVVGEEENGIGAVTAAQALAGHGIKYLVNGEPTCAKLIHAHKGGLDLQLDVKGRACHSGYPEQGDDANRRLIEVLGRLQSADWGSDPVLGPTTLNIGVFQGGVAVNVVSPAAQARLMFRTGFDLDGIMNKVRTLVGDAAEITYIGDAAPGQMMRLEGFESEVAAFCTDIPNFTPLGARALLYGPGSILTAHTDKECISLVEMAQAVSDYQRIYGILKRSC